MHLRTIRFVKIKHGVGEYTAPDGWYIVSVNPGDHFDGETEHDVVLGKNMTERNNERRDLAAKLSAKAAVTDFPAEALALDGKAAQLREPLVIPVLPTPPLRSAPRLTPADMGMCGSNSVDSLAVLPTFIPGATAQAGNGPPQRPPVRGELDR
jgi:hypothetical protein